MVGDGTPLLVHLSAHGHPLLAAAGRAGWRLQSMVSAKDAADAALFVAMDDAEARLLRDLCPDALGIGGGDDVDAVDLVVARTVPESSLASVLNHALQIAQLHCAARTDERDLEVRRRRTRQLADIGIALSTQRDPSLLLETILTEARRLADCDAGSLYLVDEMDGVRGLSFKLAQNDTAAVPFQETRLPVTASSLSGYVALTGRELNIADAYEIPATAPYRFNCSFDEQVGYRTRSMLVLPMSDHKARTIGVLQFINRLVRGPDGSTQTVPFDGEVTELLRAVASQAAVAIQKNDLLRQIRQLFESFVQASVKAIEQRDPSTSGHSFRVAETTTALLAALPRSGLARFRELEVTPEHLTEVRYAALLHDFGKVGVRESVLVKANKLSDERLEVIRYRFELHKERLRRIALERELTALHADPREFEFARRRSKQELDRAISRLDDHFAAIALANNPNVRAEGEFGHLEAIHASPFVELDGSDGRLITNDDLLALSVRRGSLTPNERRQIEAHVAYTRDFLEVLPWPPELSRVPLIAGAHHEKLDGSGYPDGRRGDDIPLPSRVMAVCDIFDALTAMDRPYKSSVSVQSAFRILEEEAAAGLIDQDIVRIFIASGSYLRGVRQTSQATPVHTHASHVGA